MQNKLFLIVSILLETDIGYQFSNCMFVPRIGFLSNSWRLHQQILARFALGMDFYSVMDNQDIASSGLLAGHVIIRLSDQCVRETLAELPPCVHMKESHCCDIRILQGMCRFSICMFNLL